MDNPRPVPSAFWVVVKNGSKILSRNAPSIPSPLSLIRMQMSFSSNTEISSFPPFGMERIPFRLILTRTCCNSSEFPSTKNGSPGIFTTNSTLLFFASFSNCSNASVITACMLTSSLSLIEVGRETFSRFSIIRDALLMALWIFMAHSFLNSGSSPSSIIN